MEVPVSLTLCLGNIPCEEYRKSSGYNEFGKTNISKEETCSCAETQL